MALSASSLLSSPFFPLVGPATLTLEVARWARRAWQGSLTSPQFPATTPLTSPSWISFLSVAPTSPSSTPLYFLSIYGYIWVYMGIYGYIWVYIGI